MSVTIGKDVPCPDEGTIEYLMYNPRAVEVFHRMMVLYAARYREQAGRPWPLVTNGDRDGREVPTQ